MKFPTVRGSGAGAEPKVAGAALSIPIGNMSTPSSAKKVCGSSPHKKVTEASSKDSYLEEQSTIATRARTNFRSRC